MKFANLQIYCIPAPWAFSPLQLQAALEHNVAVPISGSETMCQGWGVVSPDSITPLVHVVNRQMLIKLQTERKLLPAKVVNRVAREKAAELEKSQGFAPGKKAMKELKERAADELLPRAFPVLSETWTWIDPVNGWLVVDSSSSGHTYDAIKMLIKSVDNIKLELLHVQRSPVACMTAWLDNEVEAPAGFTIDQDATMRSGKAEVRYKRHTLDMTDMASHIAEGKQCVRLAMTWNDKISFVLDESLTVRSVKTLDVLRNDDHSEGHVALMTGELALMMADLVQALGGKAVA